MLIAYFAGAISGFLAELVRYDAMAAVLYISPAVEDWGYQMRVLGWIVFEVRVLDDDDVSGRVLEP